MVLAYLQRTFPANQFQEEEARKWHLEELCLRCKGSAAYNIVEAVVEEEQQWQDVHMDTQLLGPEQVDRRKGFLIADHLKPHFVAPHTHHFCPRIFFPCLRRWIQSSPIQSWASKPSHEHLCHSNFVLLQFAPEFNNRTQRLPPKLKNHNHLHTNGYSMDQLKIPCHTESKPTCCRIHIRNIHYGLTVHFMLEICQRGFPNIGTSPYPQLYAESGCKRTVSSIQWLKIHLWKQRYKQIPSKATITWPSAITLTWSDDS